MTERQALLVEIDDELALRSIGGGADDIWWGGKLWRWFQKEWRFWKAPCGWIPAPSGTSKPPPPASCGTCVCPR